MLRPTENEFRERKLLDGLWRFSVDTEGLGHEEKWWESDLAAARQIPVPASYNELFEDAAIRDHVGDVWYQKDVHLPQGWSGRRILLRFDSVTHRGTVWVNETRVASHQGGYTPFEMDLIELVAGETVFRLTVCVNNELGWKTIPPGYIETAPDGTRKQKYFHDFFNYAGIQRN